MRIEGRLFLGKQLCRIDTVAQDFAPDVRFSQALEQLLISYCHQVNVSLPLWLEKNTREFAAFHKTIFFADQFMEPVPFDRMQISLLEDA